MSDGSPRHSTGDAQPALHRLQLMLLPFLVAKQILELEHYLHRMPGGTQLAFGVFLESLLLGALTLGVGPLNIHRLVEGASARDCLTLTRLWLSDELPANSESRVLGLLLRGLRRHTAVKFVASYADPSAGHVGYIYQATNWLYTGLSQPMPLYDLGDGVARHSRTVAHTYGTHSLPYLAEQGVSVRRIPQSAKHRYVYFLDRTWRQRLRVPVLPYPKKEVGDEDR